jgi:hypothetical protein
MSKISYKRLGVTLVSLAVPFMLAGPVAAAPSAGEVASVAEECILGLGIDISTCSHAVGEGVIEVVESETNAQLAEGGVVWVVDVGHHEGDEPDDLASDINAIAVNPLPPLPPAPLVPLVPAVPFQ